MQTVVGKVFGARLSRRIRRIVSLGGRRARRKAVATLALLAMLVQLTPWRGGAVALAADTWTGATDGVWDKAGNWSTAIPGASDDVIFDTPIPASGAVITVGAGDLAQSLTFRDAYTLTGGDLTLGAAGNVTVAATFTATINSILAGGGGLTLSADNGLVGPDNQLGGGTLALTGINTYTGVTKINAGILSIVSSANLGDGSATNTIAIANNAVLQSAGTIDLTSNRSIVIGAGGATFSPTTGSLTVSGIVSGAAGNTLTKIGAGSLLLSGANTYSGDTAVNVGELVVGHKFALGDGTGVVSVASGARMVLQNGVVVTGKSLTIDGNGGNFAGALQAGAGSSEWAGPIILNGTTARLGADPAGTLTVSGVISNGTGSDLAISGPAGSSTATVILSGANTYTGKTNLIRGTLKIGANNAVPIGTILDVHQGATTDAATFDLNGFNQTVAQLQRSDTTGAGTVTNSGATASAFTVNQAANTTFGGVVSGNLSLTKTGAGTLTLSGANSYSGATSILGGALSISTIGGIGDGSATNFVNMDAGTLTWTSATAGDLGVNRSIAIGAGGATLNDTGAGALTVSGIISGAGGLTKLGSGGLILSNANTYGGGTTLSAGDLTVANDAALGTGALTMSLTGTNSRLLINGGRTVGNAITINANNPASGNGTITALGGGLVTLNGAITVNNSAGAGGTFKGGTTAADALVLNGALTAASGVTVVHRDGFVIYSGGGSISNLSVTNTALLGVTNGLPTTTIMDLGVSAAGTFDLKGFNQTLAGLQRSSAQAATVTNTGATPSVLTINGSGTTVYGGVISGAALMSVIKDGSGSQTFSGANTYSNGTTLNNGALLVGNNAALGTGAFVYNGGLLASSSATTFALTTSSVTVNADMTFGQAAAGTGAAVLAGTAELGGVVRTITADNGGGGFSGVVQNGGIIKNGLGTLTTSNAANTYVGGLTVNSGLVALSASDGSLGGAANVITLNGGGLSQPVAGSLAPATGRVFNIGGNGGTINVVSAGSTGKIFQAATTPNLFVGGSNITKTGAGDLQIAAANSTYTGTWTINGGFIELQSAAGLGSGTVTANTGGELVVSGVTLASPNNVILSGGSLSSNNATTSIVTAPVSLTANSIIGVRAFQTTTTAENLTINSSITGSSNLSVVGATGGTTSGVLTLNGNNSTFTGGVTIGSLATVQYNSLAAFGGTSSVTLAGGRANIVGVNSAGAATIGSPGVNAFYYNFGSNPVASGNPQQYAVDQLYVDPRVFTRVDSQMNVPNSGSGSGEYPILAVPGFGVQGNGGVNDGYMWKGLLNITAAGSYQFSGIDDDSLLVLIDGQTIGSIGVSAPLINIGGAVNLSAGPHSIVVKHSQGTGGGYAAVSYSGPDTGGATALVPQSALSTGSLAAMTTLPIAVTSGTGSLDLTTDAIIPALTMSSGTGFSSFSNTISNFSISSTTLAGGTNTFNPTTATMSFDGPITETAASAVTVAGPYLAKFNAINTYTGLTTVTGGELDLNATGGNSIPANLTVNAANAGGAIRNVRLLQSDQIADSATVTMTQGILDLGANSDTIGTLVTNGGTITGTGVLTVSNLGASTLNTGTILAGLAGSGGINKSGAGLLTLGGANTFTGTTTIASGAAVRAISSGALGAGGAGNGTTVNAGGQLQLAGSVNLAAAEDLSLAGTGLNSDGAVRNVAGNNTIGGIITAAPGTLVQADSGRLTFSNAAGFSVTSGAGDITFQGAGDVVLGGGISFAGSGGVVKSGSGSLIFGNNNAAFPVATASWTGTGAIGFSGAQSFGTYTVPAGKALRFESDPGSGVTLNTGGNNTIIAGYAADQALVSRVSSGSTGTLALAVDSSNNLDFSGGPNLTVASLGINMYGGTITPSGGAYNFGGTTSTVTGGLTPNILTVTGPLRGANSVNVGGGILNLTQHNSDSATANLFTGGVNITGGVVKVTNDPNLGGAAGVVNLNGGTLQLSTPEVANVAAEYGFLGSGINGSFRTINVGGNGGTIDITARNASALNGWAVTGVNGITGSSTTSTLTKSGYGQLLFLNLNDGTGAGFKGNLTLASNGGIVNILASGAVRGLNSVTVNQSATFQVDNNTTMGAGREFPFNARLGTVLTTEGDKIGDSIPITLQGGQLLLQARNVAFGVGAGNFERVGTVTAGIGQDTISAVNTGGGGADLVINNLSRVYGGGTIRASVSGLTGANGRIIPVQINGVAPTTNSFVGGWLVANTGDFGTFLTQASPGAVGGIAAYGTAGFSTYAALTAAATPGTGNFTSGTVGTMATGVALGQAGAGQNFVIGALRLNQAAAETVTFAGTTGTPDTLFIESGGLLSDGAAFARTIGATTSNFTRGQLTAGTTTATTPQELFLHNNANIFTINSVIINNPAGGTVAVIKDLDGQFNLNAANTYSGGTSVYRGTLEGQVAASLGKGAVTVKNSRLNLDVAGTIDATSTVGGFTLSDNAEVLLNNATGAFTTTWDRFTVPAGNVIIGPAANNANQGLNSLTRVFTAPTAGGQIQLAPDAIIGHQLLLNSDQNGIGANTIKNLGTNADLYYGLSADTTAGNLFASLTVGAGTPWKGISTDRTARSWRTGAIIANSDFYLQGLARDGAPVNLTLGADGSLGSYSIVNNAGKPINAYIQGQVVLQEDTPASLPGDLTFVITPGAIMQPNRTQSLGFGGTTAKIRVMAGGTLDPGAHVTVGTVANQDTATLQNLPYPLISPLNGNVTVEAGGRFVLNDASGVGSAAVGSYLLKTDSILDLGNATAFSGRGTQPMGGPVDTTGLANPGQFVYEPGAIVRVQADILGLSTFVSNATNGDKVVYEIYNGNRTLTNQNNPFIRPAVGTPTIRPESIRIANGGMLTNDTVDRTISEGRGRIVLGDGAVLAGTTGSYLNIQEGVDIEAGANIQIGSTRYIDGMTKLGGVNMGIGGPNSNTAGAGAKITVIDGAQIVFGAQNVIPDGIEVNLPAAVTTFTATGSTTAQPSVGSSILLNSGNFMEVMGKLTGNGSIIGGTGGAAIGAGFGASSDFTFNGSFRSINGQNPELFKVGTTKMTLTGSSDATVSMGVFQGTLELSGAGNTKFLTVRSMKGGTLSLDNSVTALNNRTGNPSFWVPSGGTYSLTGNATTPVTEVVQTFANSVGADLTLPNVTTGYTYVNVTPGTATTTLVASALENFQANGIAQQKGGTWVIRTATVANTGGTYGTNGALIPNAANLTNGLVIGSNPNFTSNGAFGVNAAAIVGQGGTAVAPVRGDYLGDTSATGQGVGFLTEDAIAYQGSLTSGSATVSGMNSTANLIVGMPVVGANVPAGTFITAINSATNSVTLSANASGGTGVAQQINFNAGGLRLLTANEYAAAPVNNLTTNLNVKASGIVNTSGDTRFESLTMTPGSTLNISGSLPVNSTPSRAVISAGGIFVQAGGAAATINGGPNTFLQATTSNAAALFLHTQGDLNLNAQVFSDTSIVKTGAGTLNVGSGAFGAFRGSLQVDAGTVVLGANNSLATIRATTGFTAPSGTSGLFINGGTLDLNGNSQLVGQITNTNPLFAQGGTITSATPATISTTSGGQFSGAITGAISLDKVTTGTTQTFTNDNSYTGATTIRGGTINLRDQGKLSGTSKVDLYYSSTLQLDNSYLGNVVNRINPAAAINIRGGNINIVGAPGQVSSQTFNTMNLISGRLDFANNSGGSGAIEVNIGNINRVAGGSTFSIGQNFGFVGTAGNDTDAIRYKIANVNGSPLTLNDGIIGGWAIWNGSHFLTYNAINGVGQMGNTQDGFANYDSTDPTTATATQNVNDTTATKTFAASRTINSWRMAPAAATNTFNAGVVLTIDSGAMLSDANVTISNVPATGTTGQGITSNSGELIYWVNQNTNGFSIPVIGNIDLVKSGGGGLNLTPSVTFTGTVTSGSPTVTMTTTAGLVVGQPVSGTGIPAGTTITAITPGVSITLSQNATAAGTSVTGSVANTYTGRTIVQGGTLTANLAAADGNSYVSIPGDLLVQNGTVNENATGNIKTTSNVIISGGGRLNLTSTNGVTETLQSVTFLDASGTTTIADLDRLATEQASVLRLTAPTAITATNTNPSNIPNVGGFLGSLAFTPASGASTMVINSPVPIGINNAAGLNAVGLKINSAIGSVPTGIAEGGLIKSGTGYLVLGPDQTVANATNTLTATSNVITTTTTVGLTVGMPISGTGIPAGSFITAISPNASITISNPVTTAGTNVALTASMVNFNQTPISYNGTLASLTDVFNIASGVVRFDNSQALGSNSANTTVQSGAALLGNGGTLSGSLRLKDGSTLGVTIASSSFGNPTTTVNNQSVMNVPSGNVTFSATDYFVQSTNGGTLTINSKLTGAGNINIVGPQITGATGAVVLANLLTGATAGANDYSGTITVNTNAILRQQQALLAPATSITGNTLGTATINLNGGRLSLRDDFSTTNTAQANQTAIYGNNVILSGDSFLDANRASATTTIVNNTIVLGTLNVQPGSKVLNVDSGNGYAVSFGQLDGSGTLVKAGQSTLNVNGYAGTYTGSFVLAGPQGRAVAPSTGVNFNAATNAFVNMNIGGALTLTAGKTFNVANTFSVDANSGNVGGMLAIPNTATITAGTFNNDGQVGATGGAATITATNFTGSGHYVTSGQGLTLAGKVGAGVLHAAGNNTITLTGSTIAATGIDVQSGTVRVAPAAAPLTSSGDIRVLSTPALTVAANGVPAAAVSGLLNFDGGANAITHTGNITNNATVRVSSGTVSVSGTIAGGANTYVPGLLEGYTTAPGGAMDVTATRAANPGQFGLRLEPRMLQTNVVTQQALTGHTDNDTWVYTGYVKDDDGVFSFAENIDDRAAVWIDGTLVLNAANGGTSRVVSTAYSVGQQGATVAFGSNLATPSQNFGPGITLPGYGAGWHLVEIRMNNGNGGSGPITGNGFGPNYGFGYKNGIAALDGADMIKPIDDGTGNLFVTPVNNQGVIDLLAGSTLNAGGFNQTSSVNLAATATFNVTAAGSNAADNLAVTGAAGTGSFSQVTGSSAALNNVNVAAGTKLALGGAGTTTVSNSLNLAGDLDVNDGTLNLPITGTGAGNVTVNGGLLQTQVTSNGVGTGTVTLNNSGQVQVQGNGLTSNAITVNNKALLTVTGSVASSTGVTVNNTAQFDAASAQTVKALTVNGGQARVVSAVTKIVLTVGDGTQASSQLSLTGGKLDLMTNGVAVHYAAGADNDAAALASVRSQIIAGYNPSTPTAGDGKWDGATGITSSSIGSLNAVGYALAGDVLPFTNGTTDTFLGTTVDKNTVVARFTLSGDLNLDGSVDFLDLAKLAQSYNVTDGTRQWSTGDVNYDGNTDFLDLAKMAQNYNTALGAPAVPGASVDFNADLARAFAAVPEPGSISLLGLGAVALLARRRNRRTA